MPRWISVLLFYCLAGASAVPATAETSAGGTTTDARSRVRVQRAGGSAGAGVKTTPVGAPQGAGAKMTPVSASQGAGAKMTPMSAKEGQGKYQIKRMSELNQETGGTAGASTTGAIPGIGLGGSQRQPAASGSSSSSSAAPTLRGTPFRSGRPIGGGTSSSTPSK